MSDVAPAPEPSARPARFSKRSATVSLVLVAGAGAAALALGRLDSSQREEEMLVYGSLGACIAQQVRSAEACIAAAKDAQSAYAATAPRYETEADCQRHHGRGGCVPGATVTEAAAGRTLPVMAAFMMGRTDEQAVPVQPLYPHAPEEEEPGQAASGGGHAGGYCTASGGRVAYVGSGSGVHVAATIARTVATTPRTVSRGGFGGTGRSTMASGGHAGGGG
jgi:uncharacterized protein YgiB involved in biofilm formation